MSVVDVAREIVRLAETYRVDRPLCPSIADCKPELARAVLAADELLGSLEELGEHDLSPLDTARAVEKRHGNLVAHKYLALRRALEGEAPHA